MSACRATLAIIVERSFTLTGFIMNIKFCIAGVFIAIPILFSDAVFADPIVAPFWTGNMMDDFKRPKPAPVVTKVTNTSQKTTASQPQSAKMSGEVSSGMGAPFWSGNAIGTK